MLFCRVMDQFKAAEKGDLQHLRATLTADSVNDVNGFCWTALHLAARRGFCDCVKYCIEMGANVNARTNRGWTPLHSASIHGIVNVVRVLLDAGAIVDATDDDGWTPLHNASSNGHINVVRVLLDAGANVDARDNNGRTPVYYALCYERIDVARVLFDQGGNLSNIKLDKDVPAIPEWVAVFVESRSNCRIAAIVIVGIHKYHRTTVTGNNDINVIRLISKHIWSTRMDDGWVSPPKETKAKEELMSI
jgi:hypothetical protein